MSAAGWEGQVAWKRDMNAACWIGATAIWWTFIGGWSFAVTAGAALVSMALSLATEVGAARVSGEETPKPEELGGSTARRSGGGTE